MKVIICGGRDFCDRKFIFDKLDQWHRTKTFTLVITGGARGVDTIAHQWAVARNIATKVMLADWKRDGRTAGFLRNAQMLAEHPDLVIAFHGGRGTAHMRNIATAANIKLIVT